MCTAERIRIYCRAVSYIVNQLVVCRSEYSFIMPQFLQAKDLELLCWEVLVQVLSRARSPDVGQL